MVNDRPGDDHSGPDRAVPRHAADGAIGERPESAARLEVFGGFDDRLCSLAQSLSGVLYLVYRRDDESVLFVDPAGRSRNCRKSVIEELGES